MTQSDAPLDGVRVLDLGQYIAAPGAGQALADLGADVIKVENPRGDQARSIGVFGDAMVAAYNRDKRSIAVDLRHAEGLSVLHELLADTDVLIHNFRDDSARRLGIGSEELCARYPRLIYAQVSGFGLRGPSRDRPGLDIAAQAEFGLMYSTGPADREPQRAGVAIADITAANALAGGILAALFRRANTGQGGYVHTSLLESVVSLQAALWGEYQQTGVVPTRSGNGQALAAPAADVIRVADGAIVLSAYTGHKWTALCELIDRPDLIDDPRFVDNPARVANRPQLLETLSAAFAGMTRAQATGLLDSAGIVCGAIRSLEDVANDKDVAATQIFVDVTEPNGQVSTSPGLGFTVDDTRRTRSVAAPRCGQHSAEILGELGHTPDEITRLVSEGIIHSDPQGAHQ